MEVKITNQEYHALKTHIGKSGLDTIRQSPAHYWAKHLAPDVAPSEQTTAMVTGSVVHSAILEPDTFDATYYVLPSGIDRRTKDGKGLYNYHLEAAAIEGKTLISEADVELASKLKSAVYGHYSAAFMLSNGSAERTFLFDHFQADVPCKIRLDWYNEGCDFIVDLKTTDDASPSGFARSILKYGYHRQAAFYIDGFGMATGTTPKGFFFIAVEKTPPYAVGVYSLSAEDIEKGRASYMRDLSIYADCKRSGVWPAYGEGVQEITLPTWA